MNPSIENLKGKDPMMLLYFSHMEEESLRIFEAVDDTLTSVSKIFELSKNKNNEIELDSEMYEATMFAYNLVTEAFKGLSAMYQEFISIMKEKEN